MSSAQLEYPKWGKTPRLHEFSMCITEKIDGTNGLISISKDETGELQVRAGSRSRWLTPESDNFDFAKWVAERQETLMRLGEGLHYGEYYGRAIGRGYGMQERRFALFAAERWTPAHLEQNGLGYAKSIGLDVVPLLYIGRALGERGCMEIFHNLKADGSRINNFDNPEGIVVTVLGNPKKRYKVTDMPRGSKPRESD